MRGGAMKTMLTIAVLIVSLFYLLYGDIPAIPGISGITGVPEVSEGTAMEQIEDFGGVGLDSFAASCTTNGAYIQVVNLGAFPAVFEGPNATVRIEKTVIAGNAPKELKLTITPSSGVLQNAQSGSVTDANCNSAQHGGSTCRYRFVAVKSGRELFIPPAITC